MKRFFLIFLILSVGMVHGDHRKEEMKKALRFSLEKTISGKLYGNINLGIRIETGDGETILFAVGDNKPFIPASAIKVLTSAITLSLLGDKHRFRTPIFTDGNLKGGILEGSIYLRGKGDPSLKHTHLENTAKVLKERGIYEISGDIVYDETFLDIERPRFEPNARHYYAPPGAITVNYNWLPLELSQGEDGEPILVTVPVTSYAQLNYNITVSSSLKPGRPGMTYKSMPWGDLYNINGTVTQWDKKYDYLNLCVTRPGLFGATLFKEALEQNEIIIRGNIRKGTLPEDAIRIHEIKTDTLLKVLEILNRESNNVIAELLNKDLGALYISEPGTREKGLRVMRDFCRKKFGFRVGSFSLADASGLSKKNAFSAAQFTTALNYFYSNLGEPFVRTLAPQGYHRHARYPVPPRGMRIFVKSGTLSASGVNAVVGYIFFDHSGEVFTFSILCNRTGSGPLAYSGTYTNPILSAIVDTLKTFL